MKELNKDGVQVPEWVMKSPNLFKLWSRNFEQKLRDQKDLVPNHIDYSADSSTGTSLTKEVISCPSAEIAN